MKKSKQNYLFLLTLQVLFLFIIAISGTFVSEYLIKINFFSSDWIESNRYGFDDYHWGARRIWYTWMCVTLFCLSVTRIIIWSIEYFEVKK